jgi:hypothetical protein
VAEQLAARMRGEGMRRQAFAVLLAAATAASPTYLGVTGAAAADREKTYGIGT